MKSQLVKYLGLAALFVVFTGICPDVLSQNTGGTVNLKYNYPAAKAISYLNKSTMAQIMDIQGQTMQTDVTSAFGCSVKSSGNQDNNLKLEIFIDTLGQTTNSPMGYSSGEMVGVRGKTCNIIISPDGKVVDISEAASLVFTVEGSGESNLSQNMSDLFPLLPSKPVAAGEIWNITDSVSTKSSTMSMKVVDNTINKLEGFETVDGIECAKISTQHSGTWMMDIQSQGMEISIKGPFTGTSECLFAVKEGYFVKNTSSSKMTGNLDIPSQGLSIPMVIDMKFVNEIKK
jgi:hypothetical protein